MIIVGLIGVGGLVIGNIVGRRVQRKKNAAIENGIFILISQTKEALGIAKKAQTENKILRAKIKEMGCL